MAIKIQIHSKRILVTAFDIIVLSYILGLALGFKLGLMF